MTPMPAARIRAFQLDLARHPEEPAEILRMARLAAGWGYTHLVLYLEGTIASPACPAPTASRVYSDAEVRGIAAGIAATGLAVVPVLPCLAHAEHLVGSAAWRHLAEEAGGVGRFGAVPQPSTLCPSHPETVPMLAAHIRHVCSLLPGADLHIGLDEAFNFGVCPRCRARDDLAQIWMAHLRALVAALAPLGRRLWIWDDALETFPEAIAAIPAGMLLCHWQYDSQIDASGIQGHLVNRWRRDWLALYQARGLEAIACPWIRVPQNVVQLGNYALRHPGTGLLLTSWDATHRLVPAIGLIARAGLRIWDGEEAERAWHGTASDIAGDAGALLAAVGSLPAPFSAHPACNLLGGTPSAEEDQHERLLGALEPHLDRLPAGDSAEGCDGRMLAWWTRWRLAQVRLRRYLPDLADPSLPPARRTLAIAGAQTLGRQLERLTEAVPTTFATLAAGTDDRTRRERLQSALAEQLALLRTLTTTAPTALLVLRLRHQDCYGVPSLGVDIDSGDGLWRQAASGCWKPATDGGQASSGHFTIAFPLERIPARLRLRGGGLGGAGVCFIEVRTAAGALLPTAVLAAGGAVQQPEALLRDDSAECRFGSWDIAQPMRHPPADLPSGWVEISLGEAF